VAVLITPQELEIHRVVISKAYAPGQLDYHGAEFQQLVPLEVGAVTEQVILSVPMKVVCRPDCRGLCPVCGANRNTGECQCPAAPADSPFASLK